MNALKNRLRPVWNSPLVWDCRGHFFALREKLSGYKLAKRDFFEKMGYELNLDNPQTFSEHIVHKKIFDRDPLLPILADKYKVREYIKKFLGEEESQKILIPLLFETQNPETIPFDILEREYIIKTNHNSGPHFIVENNKSIDREEIIAKLKNQLKYSYGILKHEWAYSKISPKRVVVERLIRDEQGALPKDFKFHMIKGECAFIQVDFDRFIDHSRTLYDKDWNRIGATLKFKQGREEPRPKNFDQMLQLAQKLSKPFDYVRVDLYTTQDKVYLGEMTHYPGSGMEPFTPIDYDYKFGEYWGDAK